MICEGQIQGGIAQGVGQALMENVVYDRDSGQLLSGSYMDYGMPRADDMGDLDNRISATCRAPPTRSASRAWASPARLARRPR